MSLESIRHALSGTALKIILVLIVIGFVFASYYTGSFTATSQNDAANINGQSISAIDLDRRYQQTRVSLGENFETAYPTNEAKDALRRQLLDQLIEQELIDQSARELGLVATDAEVRKAVREIPQFQENGQYSEERAKQIIASNAITQDGFKKLMQRDLRLRELQDALQRSDFALPDETRKLYALQQQQRDVAFLRIPAEKFRTESTVTDAELTEFYGANPSRFEEPEKVKVKYIRVTDTDLFEAEQANVSEDAIQEYYDSEENRSEFYSPEERKAAHILISVGPNAAESLVAEAEAKINDLRQQLDGGADFAELAADHSDDDFSAKRGGELDWFEQGIMDPAFGEAAFAMEEKGSVSEPVRSNFGFHLIKLQDVRESELMPLDQVRQTIINNVARRQAETRFYQIKSELETKADEFADSIDLIADETGLAVAESEWFDRSGAGSDIGRFPAVTARVFDADFRADGQASELMELGARDVVVVAVADHRMAGVKPLEEVREEVTNAVIAQKASAAALAKGEEIIEALSNGTTIDDVLAEEELAALELNWQKDSSLRRTSASLDYEAVEKAFELAEPVAGETIRGEELLNGDYGVFVLSSVTRPSVTQMDGVVEEQLEQQIARFHGFKSMEDYVAALKENGDVVIVN